MLHRRPTRAADDVPRRPLFSPTQLAADNPTISPLLSLSPSIASSPAVPRYKSFDTFENTASMFSFTLLVKSDGYKRSRNTRLFLFVACPDESGREVLRIGDKLIICIHRRRQRSIGLHEIIRGDARELMSYIHEKSVEYDPEPKYIAGKIAESLYHLVALCRPDALVVGSRGRRWHRHRRGEHQPVSLSPSSRPPQIPTKNRRAAIVSHIRQYLLHSAQNRKMVEKRKADLNRGKHFE